MNQTKENPKDQVCEQLRRGVRLSFRVGFCLLATLVMTACGEKTELDRHLNELCKTDGSIKVYEMVKLPSQMFHQHGIKSVRGLRGNLNLPVHILEKTKSDGSVVEILAEQYVQASNVTVLRDGNRVQGGDLLVRETYKIYRIADGKMLAESIGYSSTRAFGALALFQSKHEEVDYKTTIGTASMTASCPQGHDKLADQVFSK